MDAPAYVDAAASAVGLTIDPRHRPAVIFHLQLAASMAAQLQGVELGPPDESANVFRPVGPEDLLAATTVRGGQARGSGIGEEA